MIWDSGGTLAKNCVGTVSHRLNTVLKTVVQHIETVNFSSKASDLRKSEPVFTVSKCFTPVSRAVSRRWPTVPTQFLTTEP